MQPLPTEIIKGILTDADVRTTMARGNPFLFFNLYFPEYVVYTTADFHREMFSLIFDESIRAAVICAFRGSAKSTIFSLCYPIWAVVGVQKRKFVLMVSQTQNQARMHLANIKMELERNAMLRTELGPFREERDEWGSLSLVITKYGSRIMAASTEQSIRGVRHGSYRPDVIVADDVEDLASVKTQESRDKTFRWFMSEILPAGDLNTKIIVVGNLLHEDSLLMRLKSMIDLRQFDGVYRHYPLLNERGESIWPGKFPNQKSVQQMKLRVGEESWLREFMLKIVSPHGQVILPKWIQYYDPADINRDNIRLTAVGIDLAIAENGDRTAMVSAHVAGYGSRLRVYILPNPINECMSAPEQVETAKRLATGFSSRFDHAKLYIEDVAYQRSLVQILNNDGYDAEGVPVRGQDKRSRLASVSHLIQTGKVLFPRAGAEDLITQLTGFGSEKHDDLADALVILLLKIIEQKEEVIPRFIGSARDFYRR